MRRSTILMLAMVLLAAVASGCALRAGAGAGHTQIDIGSEGAVLVLGRAATAETAGAALRRFRVPLDAPIVIMADQTAPYKHVIPVLESVREAGYWRISFSAR